MRGKVEPDVDLRFDGEPLDNDDGRFAVDFDHPPTGTLHFEAIDRAGNRTAARRRRARDLPGVVSRGARVAARPGATTSSATACSRSSTGASSTPSSSTSRTRAASSATTRRCPRPVGSAPYAPSSTWPRPCATLEGRGVRVIGRLVAFRDPIYANDGVEAGRKDEVLQTPDGAMLSDLRRLRELRAPAVRKYNLDIAIEAVELGVDDILWDYIRRPEGQARHDGGPRPRRSEHGRRGRLPRRHPRQAAGEGRVPGGVGVRHRGRMPATPSPRTCRRWPASWTTSRR